MPLPGIEPGPLPYRGGARPSSCGGAACGTGRHRTDNLLGADQVLSRLSYGPVCASRESNPVPRCVGPMLDHSSSSRMCRPLGSNQDVPLFRRMHGPPLPGRQTTTLRSVRELNPPRCRDRAVASPDASQTRHQRTGAPRIGRRSSTPYGNRTRLFDLKGRWPHLKRERGCSTAYGCRTRLAGLRTQRPPGSRTRRE